jgi:hypothetical protein
MRNVILVLALLLGFSLVSAIAENTTPKINSTRFALDAYDKKLVAADRRQIETLIGGMQIGLMWANAFLKNRGQPMLYCQPENLKITDTQMIDMMREAMKDKPKWGDFPLGMMVVATLQRAFPCN